MQEGADARWGSETLAGIVNAGRFALPTRGRRA